MTTTGSAPPSSLPGATLLPPPVVDAVVDLLVVHQTLKKKFLLPIDNRLRRKLKLQLNCKQCNVENI